MPFDGVAPIVSEGRPSRKAVECAFCVTVYKEGADLVDRTVFSILCNIAELAHAPAEAARRDVIFIAIDGIATADQSFIAALEARNLIAPEAAEHDAGAVWYRSSHDLGALIAQFRPREERATSDLPVSEVEFVLYAKDKNRGKMDSHGIFFGTYCRQINPQFCFQIDAGTVLMPRAVLQLTRTMRDFADVAAVAPTVLTPRPTWDDNFVLSWQFCDFAFQKALIWPFEASSGYLSVIPGQACAVRWRALCGANDDGVVQADLPTPLEQYIDGNDDATTLRRLMYLAEDRVMGLNLVFSQGQRWRIAYIPSAVAITDSCETVTELLRQRRRWNNSALACRLWFWRSLWRQHRRKDPGVCRSRNLLAGLAQLAIEGRDFLAPSIVVALMHAMYSWATSGAGYARLIFVLTMWAVVALDLVANLPRVNRPSTAGKGRPFKNASFLLSICAAGMYLFFMLNLPLAAMIVLLAPALGLIPLFRILPRASRQAALRMQLSPIQHLTAVSVLSGFSKINLHDTSWGTKGLTHVGPSRGKGPTTRAFRNFVTLGWLAANALVVYLFVGKPGVITGSLNTVLEASCIFDAGLAVLASAFLLRHFRRAAKKSPAVPAPIDCAGNPTRP